RRRRHRSPSAAPARAEDRRRAPLRVHRSRVACPWSWLSGEHAAVAIDGGVCLGVEGDGAERAEERDAGERDLRARLNLEHVAARERPVDSQLKRNVCVPLGARERLESGLLGLPGRRCLDGGPDGVAGRLFGCELSLLDPGEQRHQEHERQQDTGEKEQPGDDPLTLLTVQPTDEPAHGTASAWGSGSSGSLALPVAAGRRRGSAKSRGACPLPVIAPSSACSDPRGRSPAPVPPAAVSTPAARSTPACGPPVAAARTPSWAAAM